MTSNQETLQKLAVEFTQVYEELQLHSTLMKQALSSLEDSKDRVSVLTHKLAELQQQYNSLVKETSNEQGEQEKI